MLLLAATAPLAPADAPDVEADATAAASGPAPEVEGTLKGIGVTDEALPGDLKVSGHTVGTLVEVDRLWPSMAMASVHNHDAFMLSYSCCPHKS